MVSSYGWDEEGCPKSWILPSNNLPYFLGLPVKNSLMIRPRSFNKEFIIFLICPFSSRPRSF
jgi:hypothetical protein